MTRNTRAFLQVLIPKEKYFQSEILKYLKNIENAFVWKTQAGNYQRSGLPDICCIIDGTFYGFEVKRPHFGRVSELQRDTIERINAAGGKAYVVSYVSEVEKILEHERSREK